MQLQYEYGSKIFRDFRNIEPNDWRAIIRYYERCEESVRQLDFEEYFEIILSYTRALFEIGDYTKHLVMAEVVLAESIMHNVQYVGQKDIYCETLFKKAASCYHTGQYEQCEHVLKELISINPEDKDSVAFLKKCLYLKQPRWLYNLRGLVVLSLMVCALVICIEILVVRNFYSAFSDTFEWFRIVLFAGSILVLAGGECLFRWHNHSKVNRFVALVRRRKAAKLAAKKTWFIPF